MINIISVLFLLGAIFWRIRPFLYTNKRLVSTDESFHLYYIALIKENRHQVPLKNEYAIGGPNDCTYPAFYHKLLSFFSLTFLEKYGALTAFLYDSLAATFLTYTLWVFYPLSLTDSFLFIGIYLIFPSFIFHSIGPRSYSLTPRNFSQFVCALGFICLLWHFKQSSLIFLELSAICFAIGILSSKFTVQYILATTIMFSLLLRSIDPILFLFNIIVCALFLGRKTFLLQIKGQVQHSTWYVKEGIKFIQGRWHWKELLQLLLSCQLRQAWQMMMFHNPLTRGIILNLPLFIFLFLIYASQHNPLQYFAIQIIGCSLLLWFITQFGFMRVFGEPERYIEYSIPAFLFLAFSDPNLHSFIYFIAFYSVAFVMYSWCINTKNSTLDNSKCIEEIKNFLKGENSKRTLCTLNNETYLFSTLQEEVLVGFFSNNTNSLFYRYFYDIYPDVNPHHLVELCQKYQITHVIINKNRATSKHYQLSPAEVLIENRTYKVLKLELENNYV